MASQRGVKSCSGCTKSTVGQSTNTLSFVNQQRFQKDAIWRQMQEYKRDKVSLEAKLKESSKATANHNDHLRVIDAWYSQVSIHSAIIFCFFPITNDAFS